MAVTEQLLLVGDIGGTKTDLAIVSPDAGPRRRLAEKRYPSRDYPSLEAIAHSFLADTGMRVSAACFDVAGPVIAGEADLTNLSWRLREADLARALEVDRVWLLNDLAATAAAVPLLQPEELITIHEGSPMPGGAIAVVAPGTGLGEAFLTFDGAGYWPHASEGGHSAFSPTSELELDLLRHLWERYDHVSFERVASGIGIPNLYEFFRDRRHMTEAPGVAARLAAVDDTGRTHVIIDAALDDTSRDPLAAAAVELFISILGTEAANLALKVLATGGIYLAGGIAQRLGGRLRETEFVAGLHRSGRLRSTLDRLPVHVVKVEVAMLGVAGEGVRLLADAVAQAHRAR